MIRPAPRQGWLGRLLALLAAVFLLAGPIAPPAMAMPMDCCPDTPCRDLDKSMCPQVCATACVAVPAPIESLAEPTPRHAAPPEPTPAPRLTGRAITPEPPPPR